MIGIVPRTLRRVILKHRSKPQCSHAKIVKIVKMLTNSLQVTAMAVAGLIAVAHLAAHALDAVVGRIAVGKTVGHEHVEHVGIGESHATVTAHLASLEIIFHLHCQLTHREIKFHGARLSSCNVEVNEQVVRTVETHYRVDFHSGIVGLHLSITDILPIHHELHRSSCPQTSW